MKNLEFVQLVKRMRAKQKEYFRTRNKNAMVESMHLENEVDDVIAKVEIFEAQYKEE